MLEIKRAKVRFYIAFYYRNIDIMRLKKFIDIQRKEVRKWREKNLKH